MSGVLGALGFFDSATDQAKNQTGSLPRRGGGAMLRPHKEGDGWAEAPGKPLTSLLPYLPFQKKGGIGRGIWWSPRRTVRHPNKGE